MLLTTINKDAYSITENSKSKSKKDKVWANFSHLTLVIAQEGNVIGMRELTNYPPVDVDEVDEQQGRR